MRIIELKEGKNGYGFVLSDEDCGRVINIKAKSPAAKANMKSGQNIIALKDVNEEGHEELIYVADLEVEELKKKMEKHGTLTLHVSEPQLKNLEGPWWRRTGPAPTVHPLWFQPDQSTTSGVKRRTKPPPPPSSKRKNVNLIKVSFFYYIFLNS